MIWVPLASQRMTDQRVVLVVPTQRTLSPACNLVVSMIGQRLEQT